MQNPIPSLNPSSTNISEVEKQAPTTADRPGAKVRDLNTHIESQVKSEPNADLKAFSEISEKAAKVWSAVARAESQLHLLRKLRKKGLNLNDVEGVV